MNTKLKSEKGFTIIEVLIVLAIAGLIMLVVFLAVPALQRNARNTQRKNDVSALGGALSEHISNNNGKLPTSQTEFNDDVLPNFNTSYYDKDANAFIYAKESSAANRTGPTVNENDVVHVHTYTKCDGNDAIGTGASSRSVVALYRVETGGESVLQCTEL